jgi:hypothetical protein
VAYHALPKLLLVNFRGPFNRQTVGGYLSNTQRQNREYSAMLDYNGKTLFETLAGGIGGRNQKRIGHGDGANKFPDQRPGFY